MANSGYNKIMAKLWYTYNSHANKENLLWEQLCTHALEGYYPRIKVEPVNPRSRKIRPYFPGYLFVYVDIELVGISTLQYMPYSKGLVSFGGEPAVVPEGLIRSIQQHVAWLNENEREKRLYKPGDRVEIIDGLLSGHEAIFDASISGQDRSRILIKTINDYALRIEVDNRHIFKRNT